jgi:hypothetical protein
VETDANSLVIAVPSVSRCSVAMARRWEANDVEVAGPPGSGAHRAPEINSLTDGGAADKRRPTRLRRVLSMWYIAVPILSLGYLSAIPFFHAARRLGRKDVRRRAWMFTGLVGAIVIAGATLVDNPQDPGWLGSLLYYAVFITAGVAAWQAAPLRADVYGVPSKIRTFVRETRAAPRADREERKERRVARNRGEEVAEPEEEPWTRSDWAIFSVIFVLFYGYAAFWFPIKAIRITIAHESANLGFWDQVYVIYGIVGVSSLIIAMWVFRSDARASVHWLLAGAAMIGNIYFGFAVWVIATRWVGIDEVESDPRRFGLMIWWNLVDSVPLVDIDSAFDWRRPMYGYGTTVGWLFLAQRVILVLTLARAIQVLVTRLNASPSRPVENAQVASAQRDRSQVDEGEAARHVSH